MSLLQNNKVWLDELPDFLIIQILSYLNTNDRLNASVIGKKWARLQWLPDLWRKVNAVFYGNTRRLTGALDCVPTIINRESAEVAKHIGIHLQCLNVKLISPDAHRSRKIQKELKMFLRRLTQKHCNLQELNIDFCLKSHYWSSLQRRDVVISIVRFLDTQHHLEKVTLNFVMRKDDIHLLTTLIDVSGQSLKELHCQFYYLKVPCSRIQNVFYNLSSKLPLLQTLSLPVESVDDTLVKSLSECFLKTLRILGIFKRYEAVNISSDSWIELCSNLPQLKVGFAGYLPRKLSHFPLICLPEVPLVSADLVTNDFILEEDWDINRCINYIGDSFPTTLECFSLKKISVFKPLPLDTMTILKMIDKCTKITQMVLRIPLEVSVIENICNKLSARENCTLALSKDMFGEDENKTLTEMKERYQFLDLKK